jgi:hypothetical protein
MAMLVNDRAHVDPNNIPLVSLVAQEGHVDVNFIRNNNFNNSAYRNNFASNNYRPYPIALGACPLSLKSCSRTSSVSKLLLASLLSKSWVKLIFLLLKLIALLLMLNF